MTDDLEALFGGGFLAPAQPVKNELAIQKDPSEYTNDDFKNKFIEETENVLEATKNAVISVMSEISMAPGEGESVSAAASLVNSYAKLIDNFNKMYTFHKKHENAKELIEMRNKNEAKMNTENNMTKLTMTREMVMAELLKDKDKIINVE